MRKPAPPKWCRSVQAVTIYSVTYRLVVYQILDVVSVNVGSVVPLGTGVHILDGLALSSGNSHLNGQVTNAVGILSDGAEEQAVADSLLLSSTGVEASNYQTLVPLARSEPSAVAARKPVTAPSLEQNIAIRLSLARTPLAAV